MQARAWWINLIDTSPYPPHRCPPLFTFPRLHNPKTLCKRQNPAVCLFLLLTQDMKACQKSRLTPSASRSPSGNHPCGHCERMRWPVTLLGSEPAFLLGTVCSVSLLLCPENETLKWRNQILFYLQSFKVTSSYHLSIFPKISMNLLPSQHTHWMSQTET